MTALRSRHKAALSAAGIIASIGILAAACGGSDEPEGPQLQVIEGLVPTVISSDVAVGENRFVIGLLDEEGLPVANASLEAVFAKAPEQGAEAEPAFDVNLSSITVERSFIHLHEDGERHEHEVGEIGIYVTRANFDEAGLWQVEVSGTVDEGAMPATTTLFEVREETLSPAIGAPAPASVQLTIDDVDDIAEIDTSQVPNEEMHDMTIADAVSSGRPTLIVFATPAFCTSQICGPTKEVVDTLYPEYSDEMNFIHVEPYDVPKARAGECQPLSACIVPFLTEEWGLQSEPWVFTVDADGNISGKFEGVVGEAELDEHLQTLLSGSAARAY